MSLKQFIDKMADHVAEIAGGLARLEDLLEPQKSSSSTWAISRRVSLYLKKGAQPRGAIGLYYERLAADHGAYLNRELIDSGHAQPAGF